jgi:hypothetical protein
MELGKRFLLGNLFGEITQMTLKAARVDELSKKVSLVKGENELKK